MSNFEEAYKPLLAQLREHLGEVAFIDEMEDDLAEYDGIFSDLCNAQQEFATCSWV